MADDPTHAPDGPTDSRSDSPDPSAQGEHARSVGHATATQTDPSTAAAQRERADAEEEAAGSGRSARAYWQSVSPQRRRVVIFATVLAVLGSVIAVWFGISSAAGWPVQRDLSYTVNDASSTTVRFEVTKPPAMTAVCEVVAQEVGKAVVGRTNVIIEPAEYRTTRHEVTIRTTSLAVIGLAKDCRPVDGE